MKVRSVTVMGMAAFALMAVTACGESQPVATPAAAVAPSPAPAVEPSPAPAPTPVPKPTPEPASTPTPVPLADLSLTEMHVFAGFGFSIDYPSAWFADTRESVTAISELLEDHERALVEGDFPARGYAISLDHRPMAFMGEVGLLGDPTLDDLFKLNAQFFEWQDQAESSEVVVFGVPALKVKGLGSNSWGNSLMGFLDDEAFLLTIRAPSEQALDEVLPLWDRMVESIRPVDE